MAPNPHTPTTALPWRRSSGESHEGVYHIRDAEGRRVCFAYDPTTEALIVAAVNERAALLAELDEARICAEADARRIVELRDERVLLLAERPQLRAALLNLSVACANIRNTEAQLAALADARAALAATEAP